MSAGKTGVIRDTFIHCVGKKSGLQIAIYVVNKNVPNRIESFSSLANRPSLQERLKEKVRLMSSAYQPLK